jgi:hypothetical protein
MMNVQVMIILKASVQLHSQNPVSRMVKVLTPSTCIGHSSCSHDWVHNKTSEALPGHSSKNARPKEVSDDS